MAALTQKKSCSQLMDEWKEFMWNPRTKEFMGRTAGSWALIIIFYLIFYAFLTAVFSLSMWVMLQTIDEYTPTYQDRLANPGLMMRPNMDPMEIVYSTNDSSYRPYVTNLNAVLQNYNASIQMEKGTNCSSGRYTMQDDPGDVRNYPKKACRFFREDLGDCSGISDPNYGYTNGTPCVLIKLNRVINFLPAAIPSLSNSSVTINCTSPKLKSAINETSGGGEKEQLLGSRVYFPSTAGNMGSIDLMYFPYYGNRAQGNYTQPFVAVKFLNATPNVDHHVQCTIYASNIANQDERDKFQGRVIFRLRINS